MGVALYRFFSWSDFRCSESRASSPPRLLRRLGDGGVFASSSQPSARRSDLTGSKLTFSTGALNVTPFGPVAVACFRLEDPRRTRLDSFCRTLGSRMLVEACASSHSDGMVYALVVTEYGLVVGLCAVVDDVVRSNDRQCVLEYFVFDYFGRWNGAGVAWRSSEVSGGNCGECRLMHVAPDKND